MSENIFGREVISGIKLIKEQLPKLEREVENCDIDSLRLIRSATNNNCRSRANGEIDVITFSNNYERISKAIEKFIEKCYCKKF